MVLYGLKRIGFGKPVSLDGRGHMRSLESVLEAAGIPGNSTTVTANSVEIHYSPMCDLRASMSGDCSIYAVLGRRFISGEDQIRGEVDDGRRARDLRGSGASQ